MPPFEQNIVLIGMPGAGKSTVGVLVAKMHAMGFIDTDLVVQSGEGRRLQEVIDDEGVAVFRAREERYVLTLAAGNCVIATGGSVVYSEKAMHHLGGLGKVVFLDLDLPSLRDRLTNLPCRGVVRFPGQTLEALYEERRPLYLKYAGLKVDCGGKTHEQVARAVIDAVEAG
jgi:shikimate kinase